ncbi:MAG: LPXTG cell wall anchor domain-containing protein, partial [Limosilactobacillus sp.]|nr:LPXTG cell wall anchor domain-containing protein [Limosilactobacillus sp.]
IFNDVPTPVKAGYVANVATVPAPAKPSEPGVVPGVTVTYTKNGSYMINVPAGHGETITKEYTTNVDNPAQVNGVEVPEFAGFTPVVIGATKQADGSYLPVDPTRDVTVTYTANEQSFNVTYVDITTGQTLTSHDFTLSGVTDSSYADQLTKQVWNFANAGYELDAAKNATNPIDSLSGTFGATNDNVVVYLTHQYVTVTPTSPKVAGDLIDPTNPNGPKYPVGVAENDLNQTATLTVKYGGSPVAIPDAKQTITFMRTATVDAVTGNVVYGQWNAEVATFKPVASPVIAGYVASRTVVKVATAPTPGEAVAIEVTYTPADKPDQPNTPSDQPSHGDTPADKPGDTPVKPGEGETVTPKPDQPDTPSDQPSHEETPTDKPSVTPTHPEQGNTVTPEPNQPDTSIDQPSREETPNVPMSDGLPTQPALTNPVVKEGAVTTAKQVVTTSVKKSETTNPINQQRLPQTGQAPAETNFGVLGLLAATSLSLLGFKRRERR